MSYRIRRKLTAWLGLIAMCLVAFAPTISHFVRAQRVVAIPICAPDGAGLEQRLTLSTGLMPGISPAVALSVAAMGAMRGTEMHGAHAMHMGMDMGGGEHGMPGHHDSGSQPMDDCGYCDLFNHAPAMPTVPPAPAAPLLLLFAVFVLPALTRFTPLGAFPSGRPRAPPAIS